MKSLLHVEQNLQQTVRFASMPFEYRRKLLRNIWERVSLHKALLPRIIRIHPACAMFRTPLRNTASINRIQRRAFIDIQKLYQTQTSVMG